MRVLRLCEIEKVQLDQSFSSADSQIDNQADASTTIKRLGNSALGLGFCAHRKRTSSSWPAARAPKRRPQPQRTSGVDPAASAPQLVHWYTPRADTSRPKQWRQQWGSSRHVGEFRERLAIFATSRAIFRPLVGLVRHTLDASRPEFPALRESDSDSESRSRFEPQSSSCTDDP